MTTCKKCPAWAYSHIDKDPNGVEFRMGFCRFEPPRVFRETVYVPKEGVPEYLNEKQAVLISAGWVPPTREDFWCVRGRVLMEGSGMIPKTYLTMGAPD